MSEDALLKRVEALLPGMKRLSRETRIAEGVLSRAQVEGRVAKDNLHNFLEHQLALARLMYSQSKKTISRYAAWVFMAKSWDNLVRTRGPAPVQGVGNPERPQNLQPATLKDNSGQRLYQVVVFGDVSNPKIGLVHLVWRGALARPRKGGESHPQQGGGSEQWQDVGRRLRVTKPVVSELKTELAARIRCVQLERRSPTEYLCSCVSNTWTFDPVHLVDGVKVALEVKDARQEGLRLRLQFHHSVDDVLAALADAAVFPEAAGEVPVDAPAVVRPPRLRPTARRAVPAASRVGSGAQRSRCFSAALAGHRYVCPITPLSLIGGQRPVPSDSFTPYRELRADVHSSFMSIRTHMHT